MGKSFKILCAGLATILLGACGSSVDVAATPWNTTSNLLAYYKFEESPNTTQALDSSGNAYNGVLTNMLLGSWLSPSAFMQGLTFVSASSQYIQTPLSLATATDFSISMWIKPDGSTLNTSQILFWQGNVASGNGWGATQTYVASNQEMHLSLDYFNGCFEGGVNFYYGGTDALDHSAFPGNPVCPERSQNILARDMTTVSSTAWTHIAVSVSSAAGPTATARLYVNGVLVSTDTGSEVTRTSWDSNVRIARPGHASRYYNGELDHVRVYSAALSAGEIAALYLERP